MGFSVEIVYEDGYKRNEVFEVFDLSVSEASTPLSAGDTSGSVGTFSFTAPNKQYEMDEIFDRGVLSTTSINTVLALTGPETYIGTDVRIHDGRKGFTLGRIDAVSTAPGVATYSGTTRLGRLQVYNVKANPFVGRLEDAFFYYCSLANITEDVFVDQDIADTPVVFRGFEGELWANMKQMAAAVDADISLVSGVIFLRGLRKRVAERGRDIDRGRSVGGSTLAQSVEVYWYDSTPVTNKLVYPTGGWTPEVEVYNVNAGETQEYQIEMDASISSFQQPQMRTEVSMEYNSSSVYTIVANDGLPVSPEAWRANGGNLELELNPDTTSFTLRLRGATNLPLTSGDKPAQTFSVALGSDVTGNRYSTLRIVGTGVTYKREKRAIRTGVPPSVTATEVGVTIDNPFLTDINTLYRVGTRAAKGFSGYNPELTGTVVAVNRRGDQGQVAVPTYEKVINALRDELGSGYTYLDVDNFYLSKTLNTYRAVRDYWIEFFKDDDVDQVFGNVQGARVWDEGSRRWYRIRTADLTASPISFTAEDDLTYQDAQEFYKGDTYQDLQDIFPTYELMYRAGLRRLVLAFG